MADQFIGDLRRTNQQLRDGRPVFRGATLCYTPNGNAEAVLRCDRQIRAHFKNFVKELKKHDERLQPSSRDATEPAVREGWCLSRVELDRALRDLLGQVLAARDDLRTLVLDRNNFDGSEGVVFLRRIIEQNPHVKRISFHNNSMEDPDEMALFCEAVREHRSLEHLTLDNVGLGDDEDKLSMVLVACKNLRCLGISENGIGSRGAAESIAKFLAGNMKMTNLFLRDNDFGDESADTFASALKENTNLLVLDLCGNQFTQIGRKAIRNAVFDTSGLNAATQSNHTCVVYMDDPEVLDRLKAINTGKGAPHHKAHQKVYTILHTAADVGQYLDDVPLELMPDVLVYIQELQLSNIPRGVKRHAMATLRKYTDDDFEEIFLEQTMFPLNLVFEVLRRWNLPLLYTNL